MSNTNKSFGLDIGQSTIKMVSLSSQKDGFMLDSSFIIPTPSKGMISESLLDQQEVASAIRKGLDNAKLTTKDVNIALPENQVYTKIIEMPVLSDVELSSAIYWEAEQYIPVPLSNINLVWTVLERPSASSKSDAKMIVLMVGAPKAAINKYQKVLAMANLNIVTIETEMLSTVRMLVYNNSKSGAKESSPPAVAVNIGGATTSLAILRDGALVFAYSISTGGAALSRAIENEFGISSMQAEEYKRTYGLSMQGAGEKVKKAIEPIIELILDEIRKAVVFYSQKYKDDLPIQQIILTGGSANLPGIDLFFTNSLNAETIVANPWKILANQQNIPKEMLSQASDYAIAVGLAMRGYE